MLSVLSHSAAEEPMHATSQLPSEIVVKPLIDGVAYQLPQRDPLTFPGLRKLVSVLVVVGSACAVVELVWMSLTIYNWSQGRGPHNILSALLFAVAGLPFLGIGVGLIVFGLWVSRGSCNLEIRRDSLIITDRFAFLAWRRTQNLSSVRKLRVASLPRTPRAQSPATNALTAPSVLLAESATRRLVPVVFGYPSDWLVALGLDLVSRIKRQAPQVTIEFDAGERDQTASSLRLDSQQVKIAVEVRSSRGAPKT